MNPRIALFAILLVGITAFGVKEYMAHDADAAASLLTDDPVTVQNPPPDAPDPDTQSVSDELVIEVALLLDTSNSMDGLIDQAKSQLWKMVNEFGRAKNKDGKTPILRIALYEYGNDALSSESDYIRQVTPFTEDLDALSAELFSLDTYGGSEYCGAAIKTSLQDLEWTEGEGNLRVILIAGNEPFTQGEVSYHDAIKMAREQDVLINTIFCGDMQEGIDTEWQNGALLAGGRYFSIDHNAKVIHIEAPQDAELARLSRELNDTYVAYGSVEFRKDKMENQAEQDANAADYGVANEAMRAQVKASPAYKNTNWDLVDALNEAELTLADVDDEVLPEEMQGMSKEEQEAYLEEKSAEREEIQKQIQELQKERDVYVAEERKKMGESGANTLDTAIESALSEQLEAKGFAVE